jgi:hypothetical protein
MYVWSTIDLREKVLFSSNKTCSIKLKVLYIGAVSVVYATDKYDTVVEQMEIAVRLSR